LDHKQAKNDNVELQLQCKEFTTVVKREQQQRCHGSTFPCCHGENEQKRILLFGFKGSDSTRFHVNHFAQRELFVLLLSLEK